ncbi:FixH family protein [Streptomyces sp. NPDC051940]|uniref:FixH family protein n=1 Tax=Streptomyces sp. NPDC051940 TaxID=3155675 RepID=UPI003416E51C
MSQTGPDRPVPPEPGPGVGPAAWDPDPDDGRPEWDPDPDAGPQPKRPRVLRRLVIAVVCALAAVVAVIVVGANTSPKSVTLEARTDDYQVRLELDDVSPGRRTATVRVDGTDGRPVEATRVDVRAAMPEMGMDGKVLPAREVGPGQYEAKGLLFGMTGQWVVHLRIAGAGEQRPQEAVFTIKAGP